MAAPCSGLGGGTRAIASCPSHSNFAPKARRIICPARVTITTRVFHQDKGEAVVGGEGGGGAPDEAIRANLKREDGDGKDIKCKVVELDERRGTPPGNRTPLRSRR